MDNYTNSEKVDMLLVYGFCQGNGRKSVRVYMQRFPTRRIPNHQTFASIERHLRETGSLKSNFEGRGRNRITRMLKRKKKFWQELKKNQASVHARWNVSWRFLKPS